jgi:hypothetical protein
MARENFDVDVPDGTHLGFSRDTDGAYRAHLFDDETNELVGHAELFEPEADDHASADPGYVYVNNDSSSREDEAEWSEILGALALLGVIVGAQKAAPHVKQWWNNKALPFLKDQRAKLSRTPNESGEIAATEVLLAEPEPTATDDVFAALDEYRASMSSAEARERFIAALVARLFSEKQLHLLRNARIEDELGSLELASAMDALTPEQLEEGIRAMLEANPSWPDQETVAELGKLLNGSLKQREAVPIRVVKADAGQGKHRRVE